jgi:POT family proton-dependent oligopeptide transporter
MLKKHPAGLWVLFFTEMWERFGYYLMIGIFVLYMTDAERGGLEFSDSYAGSTYGLFIALVYLTPFVGGILADRYLGYRKSVVIGGLLMAAGYFGIGLLPGAYETGRPVDMASTALGPAVDAVQTTAPTLWFYLSLGLIVFGNGFFKPNISTIVGRLYPEGSPLKDAGYNIFYMGINVGAFVCNFVAAWLRNQYGWGAAFSAAGVGLVIGVVWFLWGQSKLDGVQDRGAGGVVEEGVLKKLTLGIFVPSIVAGAAGWFLSAQLDLASTFAFLTPRNCSFFAAVLPIVAYYVLVWRRAAADERGPIAALLAIFLVVIVFWMIFHQNGNTLTLWARDHTDRVATTSRPLLEALYLAEEAPESYWENVPPAQRPAAGESVTLISTEILQSINPGFIILFTPLVVGAFAVLRRRGMEPSTPAKIAWGLLITAASTLVMVVAVRVTHGGEVRGSIGWLFGTYGVITVGELFLSPMGLSLVSKLAPARLTALMMGGWFLATAVGNNLTGVIGGLWDQVDSLETIFWINFVSALAAAGLIAVMVPWIRRVMDDHESRANGGSGDNA